MTSKAPQIHEMSTKEVRHVAVDMSGKLDTGETLTGTPIVTSSDNQTITNKAVSTAELTINGATVAIGEAIQFTLDATATGLDTVYMKCGTSSGQTVDGEITVQVC
jgi:hypothetical protein